MSQLSPIPCYSLKNAFIEVYLEDGVLGREEKVPAFAKRVVHARPRKSSYRLHEKEKIVSKKLPSPNIINQCDF